jgi:hypothetical protein
MNRDDDKRTLAPDLLAGLVWDNLDDDDPTAPGHPGTQTVDRHILGPVNLNPGLVSTSWSGGGRVLQSQVLECQWEDCHPLVLDDWFHHMALVYLEWEQLNGGDLSCAAYMSSLDRHKVVFQLTGRWVMR